MMKYTITNESVSIIVKGKVYTVQHSAPNFMALKKAVIEEDWETIEKNLTVKHSVQTWANDRFKLDDGVVLYQDKPMPDNLSRRIISMATAGEDPSTLFNFWERLQKNPSFRSVQQLWNFLEHEHIPLTPDGCFLAYKGVGRDYKDLHSRTFDNSPGTTNKMPRNEISDDPNLACHDGFHVGALNYARSFKGDAGRMVVCKIDPEHVVCVPYDSSAEKMRVCEYTVVGNYGSELPSTVFHQDPDDPNEPDDPNYDPAEDPLLDDDGDMDDDEDDDEVEEDDAAAADKEEEEADEDQGKLFDLKKGEFVKEVKPVKEPVKKPGKTPKQYAKFTKMDSEKLLKQSIGDLRKYATYGLQIVGASKIPGGKVALIHRIMDVRKRK